MKPQTIKKTIIRVIPAVLLAALSAFLLKGDVWTFWTWYLLAAVLGIAGMAITGRLFGSFADKGWMFSKVVSITITGFLTWFLVSVRILEFTTPVCVGVVIVFGLVCILAYEKQRKNGYECLPIDNLDLVYVEEILFFAVFLLWTYLAGFHPAAHGTEKFMDYGFMEAMMRSKTLPAADIWYSQGKINYYYGGQYFAVFLTKVSGTQVELTYNLMRTFVAAFAFVLPFSLVRQMTEDIQDKKISGWKKRLPSVTGFIAGLAVSVAGNMHYVVYAQIIPLIQKLKGEEVSGYWFPDATRYIGFNPDVPDKTIHEFPCYSFVLGDLHAHVVNIMFVLLLLGLLYAWMQKVRNTTPSVEELGRRKFWMQQLLMPQILAAAMLLGMFHWTNYWDFVIYYVVTGGTVLFMNIICLKGDIRWIIAVTAAQAAEIFAVATVIILPFTLQFTTMVQGVRFAQNHSLFHQLLILWGLPTILTLVFVISLITEKLKNLEHKSLYRLMKAIRTPDLFAVLMGFCAIGLVAIPEIVYVRDIYENGNARANTMFKLTYQAYIMFGMTMAYVIFRLIIVNRKKILKAVGAIGLVLLLWTCGYFGRSVDSWFGQVLDPSQYKGLNATAFLETDYAEDAGAIRWLKENIEGSPVVLEANGDSYSEYERVSAMTGLPTVMGWYVHEWLWRNDVADLNEKSAEIETVYTSTDTARVQELIEKYDISYIFVGSCEREKYEANLNNEGLQSLGEIVYQDPDYETYIVKIKLL
ncbi:MAG: DUF2298 domain-containing protein [Eubacteriales bacterium]|nr:DUF2298 domain-containing protein [Eubacteriales bacterium]